MTVDHYIFDDIEVTRDDILNCTYSNWSRHFADNVPDADVIKPLPSAFIEYLNSESIRVPKDDNDPVENTSDNDYSDWENEEENEDNGSEASGDPSTLFPEVHRQIQDSLLKFHQVMVKFNWSAPKDARWMLINNSLKCHTVNDIYLVLNASDHIAHDIDHALEEVEDKSGYEYELVIKKWLDINPALEFRIFVCNNTIIGVSQRDLNYYDYLESIKPQVKSAIEKFWHSYNLGTTSGFGNKNYIMDVYVPRPFNKVFVIDINAFSRKTDPLLFTWNELLNSHTCEFRLVDSTNMGRFAAKENSENQVPIEVVDASLNAGAMVALAKEWHDASKTYEM